jgi:MtaA/CmuA family methyltransferase
LRNTNIYIKIEKWKFFKEVNKMLNKMSSRERFFACLNGNEMDRPTVINPTSIATVESCNSVGASFNEVHLNADKMAALAAVGYEKLGFDSVMPYFSVVQEAAALGCNIDWGHTETMPNQKNSIYNEPEQFKIPDDFLDRLPIKTVIEAIKLLRKKLGSDVLIIGKVMGPWTLSYHLHGVEDFLMETIIEPDKTKEFLDRFRTITKVFAEAQFEAGADVVTLADHATADLVSPLTYKNYLLPIHKEINNTFKDKTFILHCCGNTLDRISLFAEAGFKVFHFDSKNNIDEAIKAAGNMKLTGCVNNPEVLLKGTRQQVREQVEVIIEKGIKLISPECAIPLKVRNENLMEISNTVREVKL